LKVDQPDKDIGK